MFAEPREHDGIEASFVVNHLSPYLLTELLRPTLVASAPSRVVNVTSGAVALAKRSFDAVEPPGGYYGWRWPHGFMTVIQPLTIAAMNAVMVWTLSVGSNVNCGFEPTARRTAIVSPMARRVGGIPPA